MGATARSESITTGGSFTEYPLTSNGARGIVSGSDGALWFTEPTAGKIGRITTAGVITEYTASVWEIATGPDGALWYTENGRQDRADHDRGGLSPNTPSRATGRRMASLRGRTGRCGLPKPTPRGLAASPPPASSPNTPPRRGRSTRMRLPPAWTERCGSPITTMRSDGSRLPAGLPSTRWSLPATSRSRSISLPARTAHSGSPRAGTRSGALFLPSCRPTPTTSTATATATSSGGTPATSSRSG